MKKLYALLRFRPFFLPLLLLFPLQAYPQITSNVETIEARNLTTSDMLIGRELPPPDTRGDYYYYSEWKEATVLFDGDKLLDSYLVKYDLQNNLLEIKAVGQVKILKDNRIEQMTWAGVEGPEKFINVQKLDFEGTKLAGLFKVEQEGEPYTLLSRKQPKLKKAAYMEGIDVGKRYNEILKNEEYYLATDQKLYKLTGKKKEVLRALTAATQRDVRSHVKANKLNLKTREGLLALIKWLNEG